MKEEIIEGNKLIAEFMGFDIEGNTHWEVDEDTVDDLQYNTSWDWLMPVCQKCEQVLKSEQILNSFSTYHVRYSDIMEGLRRMRIEQTYVAVVKFIHWYNTNKK